MPLYQELEAFVRGHRPHGPLTADATEPAWNGLVVFERWVTPVHTAEDILLTDLRAVWN